MQKVLFIHGGPGYNSQAERALLSKKFLKRDHQLITWDEPSLYRGSHVNDLSYLASVTSLGKFLNNFKEEHCKVIAFSFGLNYLKPLLNLVSNHQLFITSPVDCLNQLDQRLIKLAIDAPEDIDKEFLSAFLKKDHQNFDNTKIKALLTAATAQSIFLKYFYDQKNFYRYFKHLNGKYQFDMNSFIKVRQSYFETKNAQKSRKVRLIFGCNDIIIDSDTAKSRLENEFLIQETYYLEQCGHYPHIEQVSKFIDFICQ